MVGAMQHEYTELTDLSQSPAVGTNVQQAPTSTTKPSKRSLTHLLHDPEFRKHITLTFIYILLWYTFSGVLSVYNKWLFGKSERNFSFPLLVSSIHMFVQYLLATLCLWLFPRFRPIQTTSWSDYLWRAIPCGLASALDIGLSNISLQTITLSFYTMCKSSGLSFVLLFAFLFGLEKVRLVLIVIIAIVTLGIVLMAAGEVHFVWVGFIEAISSSAMSGLRWSLTQILLSQARFGMNNPVATMSRLMPIVCVSLFTFSLILENPFTEMPKNLNMQSRQDAIFIVFMMIAGGFLAFAMVLSEFFLIARTSVVTLSIGGMFKDVLMVGVAHLVFGDTMTFVNACGLFVALFGIGMYNWLKIHDTINEKSSESSNNTNNQTYLDNTEENGGGGHRQVVFATDPYDEILGVELEMNTQNQHKQDTRDDYNLQSKDAISSGVSDTNGSMARRRYSLLNHNDTPHIEIPRDNDASEAVFHDSPFSVPSNKATSPVNVPPGLSRSNSSQTNTESFIGLEQEDSDGSGPTRIKHRAE